MNEAKSSAAEPLVEIDGLSGLGFESIAMTLRAGEIVGVAGIAGSGKATFAETLVGLRPARAGTVRVEGRVLSHGVRNARDAGIGFIPRDRHRDGLVLDLSIEENATMTIDDRLGPLGWIDPRKRRNAGAKAITQLAIVAKSSSQPVSELSGGNQQKVVFARALAREPKILVAMDPTAGVDVKSKEALAAQIVRLRESGTAIVIVSDDLDDLRSCDRVMVFFAGRVAAEFSGGWRDNDLVASMEGLGVA